MRKSEGKGEEMNSADVSAESNRASTAGMVVNGKYVPTDDEVLHYEQVSLKWSLQLVD
jgi:hypothetical protein